MSSYFTFDPGQLAAAIHATGLSIPAFARAAGVNHETVLRAARGERVHIEKAVAIVHTATERATPDGQSLLRLQASSRSA